MSHTDVDIEDLPDDECLEEEEEGLREEEKIVYNTEDFISESFRSKNGTLPENILDFHYSYGYDCKRYFNLVLADEETVIFASGNFINFFNLNTNAIWFRRSYMGGGIGHITKNPNTDYAHIAVAENGIDPPIIIYEWPSFDIVDVLKGGTSRIYMHLHYSPDGMLLASQGGEPDHLITVWDWPRSKILLRTKSYVSDVHRVLFSPYVPGHLSTCGLSHIKFWKMVNSFTGLKLQGELGRFGKTEYTDILGIYGMPDEKVISGSYWGNFLIWEAGLIKVEVFRQLRKKCHDAPIVQFDFKNGELWTIGMDGRIRVWSYDAIDQADPPDDDRVVQIEPVYDFHTPNVQFMCIHKLYDNPDDTLYIAQDGNGGIWKIDLPTLTLEVRPSVQLFKCHAGKIMDIAPCPWTTYLASLGEDGRFFIYNYLTMELIFNHEFPAKGRAMIWLPLSVQKSGNEIILAFDDGNLRVIFLDMQESSPLTLHLIQVTKPHNKPITCMLLNTAGTVLVTGGEDTTIFVYQVNTPKNKYATLIPIGYIKVPGIVTCLAWHHDLVNNILIGCIHGQFVQVRVPDHPQEYTKITYILHLEPKEKRFTTYKSQIRRDIKVAEIEARKAAKREVKRQAMEQLQKENPGLEIDEEIYLADSESEEELEPLFIPEIPNRILWLRSTPENNIWLSMGGFDAGYIYEYNIKQKDEIPIKYTLIYDGDEIEISSYVYNYNKKYLFLAMQHGQIRIVRVNPEDFRDLSDYWQISMHDNLNGFIPKMCFSYDEKLFFSCGYDGNIFSYTFNPENNDYKHVLPNKERSPSGFVDVNDVYDYTTLSLEEEIVKAEMDRVERVANAHKKAILDELKILREQFDELLKRNNKLLPTQIIPKTELEIDPRITEDLQKIVDAELALEKRKLAYDVEKSEVAMKKLQRHFTDPLDVFPLVLEAIERDVKILTTRQRTLSDKFYENLNMIENKIIENELRGRPPEREKLVVELPQTVEKKEKQLEYFLLGLSPSTIQSKLGPKLTRMLHKYRCRKENRERRQQEWDKFKASKPVEGLNHPDDIAALKHAIETIGDFKLKSAADYKVPPHLRENKLKKYKELLEIRLKVYDIRLDFNSKVYKMRDRKVIMIEEFKKLHAELLLVQKEIPEGQHVTGPPIPQMYASEFPDKNIELDIQLPEKFKDKEEKKKPYIVPQPNTDLLEKEVLPYVDVDLYEDSLETPWEMEIRSIRLERKLYEQNELIKGMKNLIKTYDDQLYKLHEERHTLLVDVIYLDLHIISLRQELIVLRKFEAHEEFLSNNVNSNILDCMDMQDIITQISHKIETHKIAIDTLTEQEKTVQHQFYSAILENKFYDFLRRIFKKKYKPPKIHDPDDSESESESSDSSDESEEEDAGSVDSRDFGIIKLDDSVCPKGCDKRLYDLAFSLRTQRHNIELEIKEHRNSIEFLKKEEEAKTKKIKVLESNLVNSQFELEAFQREKQRKLNEVDKTVVVDLQKLQHVTENFQLLNIWETLLFSKTTLSKLYKRVGQLQMETLQQKAKHKVNIMHLQRMSTDCKYMEKTIKSLKEEINETMIQKFGIIVDINEVEEAYLRKLVIDLRMSQTDIKSLYNEEIRFWKNTFSETQIQLADIIKENTAKLDLLVILTRERAELLQLIHAQNRKKLQITKVIDLAQECRDDIQKLVAIIKNQKKHLQDLKDEIKTLRTKGMPIKSQLEKPLFEEEKHDEEVDSLDWIGYDEYMKTEYEHYDELEEQSEIPSKEIIKIPSAISEKTEDMAISIIIDMLEHLGEERPETTATSILRDLLKNVMNRSSVAEIIEDLLSTLNITPDEEQTSLIEMSAEKLYSLQEPEITEDDINTCACDAIAEIIEGILQLFEEPHVLIEKIILNLIQELPIIYLLRKSSIECIINKIKPLLPHLDKDELIKNMFSHKYPYINEIKELLNTILQEVFGSGLEYLYIIPDK